MVIPARVALRAATSYVEAPDGCYISTYSVASHGYAQIGWYDREVGATRGTTAHRAAWVHTDGQIPAGVTIDHTCKVRPCVRRAHLRMLSNYENARRTSGRDWPLGECVNGHPNSQLHVQPSGRRVCPPCEADHKRRWIERQTREGGHLMGVMQLQGES